MKKGFTLSILVLLTIAGLAQNRFWVAAAAGNWNDPANWSTTNGGAGGASVPGAGNTAIFNANGLGNCSLDISPTVDGITVNGYTGVIDLSGNILTTTGTNTFTSGTIINSGGAASIALNTAGSSTFNGTQFDADLTGTSGRLFFNGSIFNGSVTLTKSDNNTDTGTGGNTFNGNFSITHTGTAELRFGNTNPDTFNNLTLNINNTGDIILSRTAVGNQFNGNIIINYASIGDVFFGSNGGTSTLADTRTLSVTCGGTGCDDLTLANFTQVGNTAQSITLTGSGNARLTVGPNSIFNASVTFSAEEILFNSSTFSSTSTFTQTGTGSIGSRGGNSFQQVTINNNGSGDIHLGTNGADPGDIFNGDAVFNNSGGGRIRIGSNNAGNLFAGNLTLNNTSVVDVQNRIQVSRFAGATTTVNGTTTINNGGNGSDIHICYDAGATTTFNGDLIINNATTATGQVEFGRDGDVVINGDLTISNTSNDNIQFSAGSGTTTFGNGTIALGGSGFTDGQLRFRNFTQTGINDVNLTLTGTSTLLQLGPAASFGGNVDMRAPQLLLHGVTVAGTAYLEKTGDTNNVGNGGNTFNGITTLANSGSGYLLTANSSPDIFNGDLAINNTGNNIIYLAHNVAGNEFNGNITLNATSGNGIYFSNNAGGSSTQGAGGNVAIGGSGFSSGELRLIRFTQLGASTNTLNLTGSTILRVGPNSSFGGDVDFRAPRLFLDGFTVGGTAYLEKNGSSEDTGAGNNTFNGVTTIVNTADGNLRTQGNNTFNSTTNLTNSGTAYLLLEFSSGSTYNGAVTFSNTSTSNIRVAYAGATTFNGNLIFNNPSGTGIVFCETAGATATLADTYAMAVGGSGFSVGTLNLNRFTQVGSTAQSLTLTGTAVLNLGPDSQFDGDVNFVSPRVLLNGTIFNGSAYIEKNGATNDTGTGNNTFNGTATLVNSSPSVFRTNGNNTFNGVTTFINSGSQDILFELNTGSTYNNTVTFQNTGSSSIRAAYNGTNAFNGNIIVENTVGTGVIFCESAAATATLADTRTITIGGLGFNAGDLRLQRFTQVGGTAQTLTLTGSALLTLGPSSAFGGDVTFTSPRVLLNGTTYSGNAYIEKTSVTGDDGTGGNTFNGTTTLVNSGDAYFSTGNNNPDVFNGNLIVTNLGASTIRLANNSAGNQFNGNIELNSTFGGGIWFGNGGSASATLAAARTIGVGGLGVISGDVRLIRFTQVGPTAQTLNLTGIAILTLGPSSSFGGNVDFRSPQLLLNGTTFDGTAYLEKNGATDNAGTGGNTFNSTTTLVNAGSGYLLSANNSPDIFNGDLTVTNTGSNIIYLAHNVPGNEFNGDITFNSTLGSGGVYISNNGPGVSTLGVGGSLLVGGSGFSSGRLRIRTFTQLGADPQTLVLSGSAILELGPGTTFNGVVDFRSPQFELDGVTFNGTTYLEKTGAGNNDSSGGNIFNGITTIANSGSGYFRFALTALDQFNNDVTITNTGSGTIRMADNTPGTVFNGNIIVNSTFGGGIYFSESGGGTATLAAGRTISVGGSGFTTGDLRLRRFTQSGATAQTLTLTGTARLLLGPSLIFNGNVTLEAPQVFLQGGTYNGTASITKTGAGDNVGNGGNTFNGTTTLANSGSGYFMTGNSSPDIFNAVLTLNNSGTSTIRLANDTPGNEFNGNITFTSTSGGGVWIGQGANALSTLASGRTLNVGTFTSGEVRLRRFTQAGATGQSMTLTGTALLRIGPSVTFNAAVTFAAPQVELEGGTFNGTTAISKTGASNNDNAGNNTFNGLTTLTNSSTARWRLSNGGTGDTYNGSVTFINSSSGTFEPAFNNTNFFASNITINSNAVLTLANGNGTVEFTGGNNQTIGKTFGTPTPVFRRINVNKSANTVTLNTDLTVSISAAFTSGVVNTDATNFLNIADNATTTGANDLSYVDGPVRKTGNDAFDFPVGDNGFYRPISISAPTTATHAFTAQYLNQNHLLGSPAVWDPSFWTVSGCEYWTLDRNVGASNVFVTLSWNEAACNPGYITNPATLRVTRWTGTNWVDQGNGGTTGTPTNGTIITSAAVTSFSPFTLASTDAQNPLPVELEWFRASVTPETSVLLEWRTSSELNNEAFEVERSKDGFDFTQIARINGAGTTTQKNDYTLLDEQPLAGLSYYRLKQIDFDGTVTYSGLVSVRRGEDPFIVYPNPAGKQWVTFNRKVNAVVINNLNQIIGTYAEADGFDTSNLAPGMYIVRTHQGEIFKLVIQ